MAGTAAGTDATHPLRQVRSAARSAADELLMQVLACGVCRSDRHVAEGDLPAHRPGVVLVTRWSARSSNYPPASSARDSVSASPGCAGPAGRADTAPAGQRTCAPRSGYTRCDADGGYPEFATVPATYAYPLPNGYPYAELAPLLCAGITGWQALVQPKSSTDSAPAPT